MKKEYAMMAQGAVAAVGALLSDRLGILYPVLCALIAVMVIDYITGMAASKAEAIDHPDDPNYGWSSKKGAKGILKKFGYACVITAAVLVDYIISLTSQRLGFNMPANIFFGLLVSIWYFLNEILSIIENAGRMGADVPKWLCDYIMVLKSKVNDEGEKK